MCWSGGRWGARGAREGAHISNVASVTHITPRPAPPPRTHTRAARTHRLTPRCAAMGGAIASRATFGTDGLDFTKNNERLLRDLSQYVDELVRDHPLEAALRFVSPLKWTTTLSPDDVARAVGGGSDSGVDGDGEVRVHTFADLGKVLAAAGDNRLVELKSALHCGMRSLWLGGRCLALTLPFVVFSQSTETQS